MLRPVRRSVCMRTKRTISLFLLAVYLLMTGVPAWMSLTCGCLTLHAEPTRCCAAHEAHDGCGHHAHWPASDHHCHRAYCVTSPYGTTDTHLSAACCDRHSTELPLYTFAGDDDDRTVRCAVQLHPFVPASAPERGAGLMRGSEHSAGRHAPPVRAGYLRCAQLRAPPVSV